MRVWYYLLVVLAGLNLGFVVVDIGTHDIGPLTFLNLIVGALCAYTAYSVNKELQ